ncbi:MAG TPA: hypothetical protein VHN98_03850 [Acidimicrobiales bacterium]|nr:hypothetical protein [Acidimicrobiales bacterium]
MTASYVEADRDAAGAMLCPACGWVRAGDGCSCGDAMSSSLPAVRWFDVAAVTILVVGLVSLLVLAAA